MKRLRDFTVRLRRLGTTVRLSLWPPMHPDVSPREQQLANVAGWVGVAIGAAAVAALIVVVWL